MLVPAMVQVAPSRGGTVVALPTLESDRVDDAGLVVRGQRGDGWAQEAIYRRHVRLVASIAMG
jgi:hypothetical protein